VKGREKWKKEWRDAGKGFQRCGKMEEMEEIADEMEEMEKMAGTGSQYSGAGH
jgi:hypothetical protein